MREIKITVKKNGETITDFAGYTGSACLDAGKKLQDLLAAYGIQSDQTTFVPKPELQQQLAVNDAERHVQQEQ